MHGTVSDGDYAAAEAEFQSHASAATELAAAGTHTALHVTVRTRGRRLVPSLSVVMFANSWGRQAEAVTIAAVSLNPYGAR